MALAGWLEPSFQGIRAVRSGAADFFLGLLRGPFLIEENRLLREQLSAAVAHEQTHEDLAMENARLRALMEFRARSPWRLIAAQVIGRELGPWSRTLLLDKGRRDRFREGMAVITPVGLVGRISEVGASTSRVSLLADPHFRVAGTLVSLRVTALVTGTASGECLLTYVPLDAELKEGLAVLTAGGRSFCPQGIPIGTLQKPREDPSRLFLSARIRPAVNCAALEEVLVVESFGSDEPSS